MQVNCDDETAAGVEPNNTFAEAHVVDPGSSTSFARCGASDVDYYKVTVPALNGVEVTLEHETEAEPPAQTGTRRDPRLEAPDGVGAAEQVKGAVGARVRGADDGEVAVDVRDARQHHLELPHHLVILVLEDVAVVGEQAGEVLESRGALRGGEELDPTRRVLQHAERHLPLVAP